jgi:hypothetical protein
MNVAVEEPVATIADAGTVRFALLLTSAITVNPVAGLVKVTVQELVVPELRLEGLQVTEETANRASRFRVALCEPPFRVAVTVAV